MKQMTFLIYVPASAASGSVLKLPAINASGTVNMIICKSSYEAMYDTEGEWKADDVTKLKPSDVPRADIGALDSPVRIFQSQESNGDWSEKEVEYILTLLTSSKAKKKVISHIPFC